MLHNRQAPGRDFHKHFSLAQPVVIPTPQATRNPPPLPIPYKTGLKLAMRRREQPTCHSSLSLPPPHPACALPPACAPYPRPTPSPLPSLHLHQCVVLSDTPNEEPAWREQHAPQDAEAVPYINYVTLPPRPPAHGPTSSTPDAEPAVADCLCRATCRDVFRVFCRLPWHRQASAAPP